MNQQISTNVRYLLLRKGIPRVQWERWVSGHTSLDRQTSRMLVSGALSDAQVSSDILRNLAGAFDLEDEGENLRFADLAREGCNVLQENLRFLFGSLGHGGKKTAAADLGVDPTTVSRWLSGSYEPQSGFLRQIVSFFGLPVETDLRETPVFLSAEPVAVSERRRWLQARVDALSAEELRELYPALRRLLEER